MLPEIGASELLVIAVVALIVVGPKDLPLLMRRVGQIMAKVRGMAAEFRASFDDMARQSELEELRKEVEAMRRGQIADLAIGDGMNEAAADIEKSLSDVGVQLGSPTYEYAQTSEPPEPDPAPTLASAPVATPAGEAAAKPARKPRAGPAKPKAAKTGGKTAADGAKTATRTAKPRAAKKAAE